MRTIVITPPDPIVTLEEAKTHLRVDFTTLDAQITAFVLAATERIDGPGGDLQRALGPQTLEWRGDSFGCGIALLGPVLEVESVTYVDADQAEQTLASSVYELDNETLRLAHGQSWPPLGDTAEPIRVRYRAGYESSDSPVTAAVPEPIRTAILVQTEILFTRPVGDAREALERIRDDLLSRYRRWRG